jgi:hypothetical protein
MIDVEKFIISLRLNRHADGRLNPIHLADTVQEEIKIVEEAIKYSQGTWVGLTKEERHEISLANKPYVADIMAAHEEELKRRNT